MVKLNRYVLFDLWNSVSSQALRYIRWQHSWKTTTAGVVAVFLGMFLFVTLHSSAATSTMVPVSDVTAGWATTGGTDTSCSGGTHCDFVDDGASDDTNTYVGTGTGGTTGEVEEYALDNNTTGIATATSIVLRVYAQSATNANGGTLDDISIRARINGTLQTATTCTPAFNTWAACTSSLSGSWSQSDIDSLQAQITRTRQGSGGPSSQDDDVRIANVYVTLTYTATASYEQSAYRWYANQDTSSATTFATAYGVSGAEDGYGIAQTSDGGYVTTGSVTSNSGDMVLSKFTSAGTLSWSKSWGGSGNNEVGNAVIQSSDGGYVVVGNTFTFGAGQAEMFVAKFTSTGSLSWNKTWGGSLNDYGYGVAEQTNGDIAITGGSNNVGGGGYDMVLVSLSSTGSLNWTREWGSTGDEYGRAVTATSDGGYIVAGQTGSYGTSGTIDAFIAKYTSTGSLSWSKTWGNTATDIARAVVQTSDGGYAITGFSNSYGAGSSDVLVAKYDSAGSLSWTRMIGGASADEAYDLQQTSDDGFVVTGMTQSYGSGSSDAFMAKLNSSGAVSWSRTFGSTSLDEAYGVVQTSDGGYAMVGHSPTYGTGGALIVKYDATPSISGCGNPPCQSPTATNSSPTVNTTSPTATTNTTAATLGTPSATTVDSGATTTPIVAVNPSIDVSSTLAALNTAATAPAEGTIFRLRFGVHVSGGSISPGAVYFKLQYAAKGGAGSCSTVSTGTFADVSDSTTIRYADNTTAGSGLSLTTNANDPTHSSDSLVRQMYLEKGTTTFTNSSTINVGNDGIWDFALKAYHSLSGDTYCFRLVKADNSLLNTNTVYPEISMPAATFSQGAYRWYDADQTTSLSAKAWGGSSNEDGYQAVQTSDGGYAVTGTTTSFGAGLDDMFIAKYDSTGALSWNKTWGGTGYDKGYDIVQTSDGGYAVTGSTTSFGAGNQDMFLVKYDSSGTLSWNKTWGGTNADLGNSLVQTSDGGYAVTGQSESTGLGDGDVYIAKFDSAGALSWTKDWSVSVDDQGYAIIQTSDGGYALTGAYGYGGGGDVLSFIAKLTSTGSMTWSRTWGGGLSSLGHAESVVQTSDGGYAITGMTDSFGAGSEDMFINKYDSSGTLSWNKTWGGTGYDGGQDIVQTTDGGYAITGYTQSFGVGSFDTALVKLDSSGNLSWSKTWGSSGAEIGRSIVQTSDNGFAVAGYTGSYGAGPNEMLLLKYDSSGSLSGCTASNCTTPSVTLGNPSATIGTSSYTIFSNSLTLGTPSATTSTPSATSTVILGGSIGSPLISQNTPLDFVSKQPVTLKIAIPINSSGITTSAQAFKLQFATLGSSATCSAVSSGSYADVTTGTALRYYDDSRYTSGSGIGADAGDPTDSGRAMKQQSYQESNNFSNSASAVYADEDGLWQFMLTVSSSAYQGDIYCIRVATSGGTLLSASNIAELRVSPDLSRMMKGGNSFSLQGTKNYKNL